MAIGRNDLIYVAGHRGLAGSAIHRALKKNGYHNIITRTHHELDLIDAQAVKNFFEEHKPAAVILAAAKVGGIYANMTQPADFLRENLLIQTNVIDSAYKSGTKKLLFLGSSCIYPANPPQPIKEEYLLTGPLEKTNDAYALAKIAGIKMCQAYRAQYGFDAISAMPTNLYGPGDNYHPTNSHVIPAMIRRFTEAAKNRAPSAVIWGSGRPRREFLHSDDLGEACVFLLENYSGELPINIGTGVDITIMELAAMVAEACGFKGQIVTDESMPDGVARKLLDVGRLFKMGWRPKISLREGLKETAADFARHGLEA